METKSIECMVGKTFDAVLRHGADELFFTDATGKKGVRFFHFQNCCEDVEIDDIVGDLDDLVGNPILRAEEASSESEEQGRTTKYGDPMYGTWTFYKFETVKGSVTVKWLGTSNGFYSEKVSWEEIK